MKLELSPGRLSHAYANFEIDRSNQTLLFPTFSGKRHSKISAARQKRATLISSSSNFLSNQAACS